MSMYELLKPRNPNLERRITQACRKLVDGKDGNGQPEEIHGPMLRILEELKLAKFQKGRGWFLTKAGEMRKNKKLERSKAA